MAESSHFYSRQGEPKFEVPYADASKGMRKATLADAKKNGWLPSVTTITRVLNAPALVDWKVRNGIMAALTTPRNENEPLDDFVNRILAVDVESIGDAAKQLGTDIHDDIESYLTNGGVKRPDLIPYISPVAQEVKLLGNVIATEKILVGDCYAGRTDCILESDELITVVDFKTTGSKQLPKKSYAEHRIQLAGYAAALGNTGNKRISTLNIYISTIRAGEIAVCKNEDWQTDFEIFKKVCDIWQWQNNYFPSREESTEENFDIMP
ncbi:MAG: PD-(D/E)XK nuclease family protein [Patescibacteria group bacterium]|nr:PD-(D/E)XK nuclease family protein [Patescibacteria group bacterium]